MSTSTTTNYYKYMSLKHPTPLNENEWNSLMRQLEEEEPNPEKTRMLKQAIENGGKIKEHL
jgi:hypothetical protein